MLTGGGSSSTIAAFSSMPPSLPLEPPIGVPPAAIATATPTSAAATKAPLDSALASRAGPVRSSRGGGGEDQVIVIVAFVSTATGKGRSMERAAVNSNGATTQACIVPPPTPSTAGNATKPSRAPS